VCRCAILRAHSDSALQESIWPCSTVPGIISSRSRHMLTHRDSAFDEIHRNAQNSFISFIIITFTRLAPFYMGAQVQNLS
jgi:hypothetical protein